MPDVMTLAKGLGGGLPIGAVHRDRRGRRTVRAGHARHTFGGNPVCAAAALAVLRTIDEEDLLSHVESVGKTLATASRCSDIR